jgi:acyl dehydratase
MPYFESFEPGACYGTPARTIDAEAIASFAHLTGDDNPVHLDPAHARRTLFRGCVAHGMLVESALSGCVWQSGLFRDSIQALLAVETRFVAPVRPGDSVRMELTVESLDPTPSRRAGWVRFTTRGLNQRDEEISRGVWQVLVARTAMR